jgi:hypothetical protein
MTGDNDAFEYDIAFSFVAEDEGLATQLNDRLQDRYRTFLYSKAQKQLAGTDGEKTFNAVFGKEARIVAVLLRPEWGYTSRIRFHDVCRDGTWDCDSQLAAQGTYLAQPCKVRT